MKLCKTYIIFDLDETIGYFSEFGIFYDALKEYLKRDITQEEFNNLIDMNIECLRPNILKVFKHIKKIKQSKNNVCVVLYTNNNGSNEWVDSIISYIETKIVYKLFDKKIRAYKIGNKQVEPQRTSHEKRHEDFINIMGCSPQSKLFFIDDRLHRGMLKMDTRYLWIKPYKFHIPFDVMAKRYLLNSNGNNNNEDGQSEYATINMDGNNFISFIKNYSNGFSICDKTEWSMEDMNSADFIISNLNSFLSSTKKTYKNKRGGKGKTNEKNEKNENTNKTYLEKMREKYKRRTRKNRKKHKKT